MKMKAPFPAPEHVERLELMRALRNKTKFNDVGERIGKTEDDLLKIKQDCIDHELLDDNGQLTLTGAIYLALGDHQTPVPIKETVPSLPKDPAELPPEGESSPIPDVIEVRQLWRRVGGDEPDFRASLATLIHFGLVERDYPLFWIPGE